VRHVAAAMIETFLETISHLPEREIPPGKVILRQGERRGQLWILLRGTVEIIKNETPICKVAERGAIFGEMSVLLRTFQLASVQTAEPCAFRVIEDAETFLTGNSAASVVLAKMLAKRLALLDSNFSKLKSDYQKLKAEYDAQARPEDTGTKLVSRFIADAERSLGDPLSRDSA
jgi:CRP/FNR family transcriptional regulator, cyclic AMP receptor protein